MESKTATALGAGIVSVVTPLVFPAIPLALGIGFYTVAGGLLIYAGRDEIRSRLPARWRRINNEASDGPQKSTAKTLASTAPSSSDPHHGPVELTHYLASRLVAQPIHPKTLQVIRFIASQTTPEFFLEDAIRAVAGAKSYMDLKGAWAGLTRRTRNMLNDREAELIQWRESYDENGDHLDWIGKISPMTHSSLRKHLGISGGS